MRGGAPEWERRYALKLVLTDTLIVLAAVFTAQVIRFGIAATELNISVTDRSQFGLTYSLLSVVMVAAWLIALEVGETRDPKAFGTGISEYKRVINSTLFVFGLFAIISYASRAEIGRGYLLIALPLGLVLLAVSRLLWRKRLHDQRRKGRNMYRTLVAGERYKAVHVLSELQRDAFAGFDLIGMVTHRGTPTDVIPGVPVLGALDHLIDIVDAENIETLVMVSSDEISPEQLRQIGWELETRGVDLVVAASLTDIAGPRIHARPVAGLPLIHVAYPKFVGRRRLIKRFFDVISSGLGMLVLSPVFLVIALAVKLGSKGPVFFRQERVGLEGVPFKMLKFRSMVVDAEDRLPGLLDQSDGNGLLFKMKDDPRITKVGKFLRKYSIDELPQLMNVFVGDMSLVGPRPPLPREVDQYDRWTKRRLLVLPGITGLWQVSGRSDLSWEDSIRLDLYYVENWSLVGDILILMRTVKTVLRPSGAY